MTKKIPVWLKQEWDNSVVLVSNPYSLCVTDNSTEDHQNLLKASLQDAGSGNLEFVVFLSLLSLLVPVNSVVLENKTKISFQENEEHVY